MDGGISTEQGVIVSDRMRAKCGVNKPGPGRILCPGVQGRDQQSSAVRRVVVNAHMLTQFRVYLEDEIRGNETLRGEEKSPVLRAATRGRIEALREALEEFNCLLAACGEERV